MLKLLQAAKLSGNTRNILSPRGIHTSRTMRNKQAVIFDMGGVILPSPVSLVHKFAVKHQLSQSQMDNLLFNEGDKSLWGQLECGEITIEGFSKRLSQRCEELFGTAYEDEIITTMVHNKRFNTPYPEMLSVIKQLRQKGFKTALLTNNFYSDNGESCMPLDKDLFDVVSKIT